MRISVRSISSTARLVHWISLLACFYYDLMVHIFLDLFYFLILYFYWLNFQKFITLLFFIQKLWKKITKIIWIISDLMTIFSHFYFDIWYFLYFLNYLLSFNYLKNTFWHLLILKKIHKYYFAYFWISENFMEFYVKVYHFLPILCLFEQF